MTFNTCQSADEPRVSTEVEAVGCKECLSHWAVSCHMTDFLLKTKVNFLYVLTAKEKNAECFFFLCSVSSRFKGLCVCLSFLQEDEDVAGDPAPHKW